MLYEVITGSLHDQNERVFSNQVDGGPGVVPLPCDRRVSWIAQSVGNGFAVTGTEEECTIEYQSFDRLGRPEIAEVVGVRGVGNVERDGVAEIFV